jgi:hypothetical protein
MSNFHHTVYLETKDICLELVCELEYIPAEGDGWNEPRYEASVVLGSAKLGDIEIISALSDEDIQTIEQQAMEECGDDAREAESEARYERWKDRNNG